ncbi:MAG: hypothetical protein ACK5KP_02185 [Paludibacteraceae bacterium]
MKKSIFCVAIIFLAVNLSLTATAQSTSVANLTPEQEASKQTEKLQQELNLSSQQAKDVYDINLKYALERKQSNKRSDAVVRIKKKNEEINRILNSTQKEELQSKRSRIQSVNIDGEERYTRTDYSTRVDASSARSNSNLSGSQERPVRTSSQRRPLYGTQNADRPVRSSERSVRPTNSQTRENRSGTPSRGTLQSTRNTERSSSGQTNQSRSSGTSGNSSQQRGTQASGSRR